MKYTIFSIDNPTDWHQMAKFMRYVDERMAMGKTKGKFIQCVGSWEGVIEPSFLCRTEDFEEHILKSGYVDKQDCVLQISECNKQYAQLLWLLEGTTEFVGSLKSVDKETALKENGWTYRPDLNTYWVTVKGNPDTVHGDKTND